MNSSELFVPAPTETDGAGRESQSTSLSTSTSPWKTFWNRVSPTLKPALLHVTHRAENFAAWLVLPNSQTSKSQVRSHAWAVTIAMWAAAATGWSVGPTFRFSSPLLAAAAFWLLLWLVAVATQKSLLRLPDKKQAPDAGGATASPTWKSLLLPSCHLALLIAMKVKL